MLEVVFEGNTYRFCRGEKKAYWLAISRGNKAPCHPAFSGSNCVVPSSFWSDLRQSAIEGGVDAVMFDTPKIEKKKSASRRKRQVKNVISIF